MAESFSWKCPYCNHRATIRKQDCSEQAHRFKRPGNTNGLSLLTLMIACPNPECEEFSVNAKLHKTTCEGLSNWNDEISPINSWRLKPESKAKVFPSYIPKAILEDYKEACLILNLSPKASATLSRRCLQGIIRDFHEIKENRLYDEIEALKDKIDPLVWQAIDAVRNIGNIGAHMEKDINTIIEVEPQEASKLIALIEMLLKDWYIDKHEKEKQLQEIVKIADTKKEKKKENNNSQEEES